MSIWLVMKTADGKERPFPIQKTRTVIGRETRCDVRIPISSVANQHCEIRLEDEVLHLTDLNSVGGTLHNGNPVNNAKLTHADTLTIGPVTFEVRILPGDQETIIYRKDDAQADPPPES